MRQAGRDLPRGSAGDARSGRAHDARDARFGGIFDALADWVAGAAHPGEVLFAELCAERADYLRLNRARVRQAGSVERSIATLRLFRGGRQALMRCALASPRRVAAVLREALRELRAATSSLEPDPFALWEHAPGTSEHVAGGAQASPQAAIDTIVDAAGGDDLVGLYTAGPVVRALASSLGHRHYHETCSSCLDFSIHVEGTRAVKDVWTSDAWEPSSLRASIAAARERARWLSRPPCRVDPGEYRVLLSARAVADLVGLLGWGGFSERAWHSGQSPLARAQRGEARFHPSFTLVEDFSALGVPRFQGEGFERPAAIPLIDAGQPAQRLVSPRSAREFGAQANGADDDERPQAASVAPGRLREAEALAALDTGIVVENLWYLNYSDRQACRATGLTRFATLWVRNGEPVAPVEAMRFDDSLYRVFGPGLLALTDSVRRMPLVETWDGREPGGCCAPGALVEGFRLTL